MKKIFGLAISFISLFALASCGRGEGTLLPSMDKPVVDDPVDNSVTVTDSLGRVVKIEDTTDLKTVCIGAGSLRLYSYVVGAIGLVGTEDIDKNEGGPFAGIPVPYKDANMDYFSTLPSCGKGGPQGQTPEREKILECRPNIVLSMLTDAQAANELQDALGVPVVCLSYGKTQVFNDNLMYSFTLLGKIFNKEARALELKNAIENVKNELNDLTKNITEKKSVYLGCLGNYGVQDIFSSASHYSLFEVSNIKNVLDADNEKTGYLTVDKEALVKYNPDKIILDAAGVAKFAATYKEDSETFDSLNAFKNNEVYLQMPYNAYYTNIEVALIDAYYSAMVAYDLTSFNMDEIANRITKLFIGKEMANDIKNKAKGYGGFQKVTKEFLGSLA